jgi:hypothetical protein
MADTDAVTLAGAAFLLEGRRGSPYPQPSRISGETLGFVRAAASSSSHPFLKVLLWYAALRRAKIVVEFSGGRNGCGSSLFLSIRLCRHCFPFIFFFCFLLGFVVLFGPAMISMLYRW